MKLKEIERLFYRSHPGCDSSCDRRFKFYFPDKTMGMCISDLSDSLFLELRSNEEKRSPLFYNIQDSIKEAYHGE